MPKEDGYKNLERFQTSEHKSAAAKSKKGMLYYTTRIRNTYVKSTDLVKSIKAAQKRQRTLLEKSNTDEKLTEDEVKELSVINLFLKPFLDKAVASKIESDNKLEVSGKINFFTVQPDTDD